MSVRWNPISVTYSLEFAYSKNGFIDIFQRHLWLNPCHLSRIRSYKILIHKVTSVLLTPDHHISLMGDKVASRHSSAFIVCKWYICSVYLLHREIVCFVRYMHAMEVHRAIFCIKSEIYVLLHVIGCFVFSFGNTVIYPFECRKYELKKFIPRRHLCANTSRVEGVSKTKCVISVQYHTSAKNE